MATGKLFVVVGDAVLGVDLDRGNAPSVIGHIMHGHAVVPIPGTAVPLVTSGRDDSVWLVDRRGGAALARLPVGRDPDAAIFDPEGRHVLVMSGEVGTVSEVDPVVHRVVRTMVLRPGLEFPAIGPDRTLFVNNEDAGAIETLDLRSSRRGALPGCTGATGLAFDARSNRLIGACANGRAAVVDPIARRLVTLVSIGQGPDAVILDGARRLASIPCGKNGTLAVLALDGPRGVATVANIRTGPGALYLPSALLRARVAAGGLQILVVRPAPRGAGDR